MSVVHHKAPEEAFMLDLSKVEISRAKAMVDKTSNGTEPGRPTAQLSQYPPRMAFIPSLDNRELLISPREDEMSEQAITRPSDMMLAGGCWMLYIYVLQGAPTRSITSSYLESTFRGTPSGSLSTTMRLHHGGKGGRPPSSLITHIRWSNQSSSDTHSSRCCKRDSALQWEC